MKAEYIPLAVIPLLIIISGIFAYTLKVSMTLILCILVITTEVFYITFDKKPDGELGEGGKMAKEIFLGTALFFAGVFIAQLIVKYYLR